MNARGLKFLDLAMRAFPRARRERDGEVIRDLAIEMVEGGSRVSRQAASLLLAGMLDRAKTLGSSPLVFNFRGGLVALAIALAPVQFAIVLLALASTLFFDLPLPNNSLGAGLELNSYSMVHAGVPWALCILGSASAAIGFNRGSRSLARFGSASAFIGTWLLVGTMGGWMPGSGFVGPAEIPGQTSLDGISRSIYVVAVSAAITAIMGAASLAMSNTSPIPNRTEFLGRPLAPGITVCVGIGTISALAPMYADFIFSSFAGFLAVLPLWAMRLYRSDTTREYSFAAFLIGLVVLTVPTLFIVDQFLGQLDGLSIGFLEIALLAIMPAFIIPDVFKTLKAMWQCRAHA